MRIYVRPNAPIVIRLQIVKQGFKTEYLNIMDATLNEVVAMVKKVILQQKISPFVVGKVTQVRCREGEGAKNGKGISVSFRGINPDKALKLIEDHVKNLTK